MGGRHGDGGREAVSWLATGIVFFLGICFCGFIALMFAKDPKTPILTLSAVFLGFALLIWLLRDKSESADDDEERTWFGLFRKPKPTVEVKLHRRNKPKIVSFGTNQPPTAERIREIKELTDGMKNWSPPATDPHHDESAHEQAPSPKHRPVGPARESPGETA